LENLGDRDGVFKAKTEMFDYAAKDCFVVLNGDDDKLSNVEDVNGRKPIFFGVETDRDVMALEYNADGICGTDVKIKYFDKLLDTHIPIPGFHMIYNALAAVCIGSHFGMTLEEIDKGIRNLKAIGGRNNIFKVNDITVIDDCYNANPMSMEASLRVLNQAEGRKVAILGDMFELGADEINLHKQVGSVAAGLKLDAIICIGKLAKNIAETAKKGTAEVIYFENKSDFEEKMFNYIGAEATVLIKASNGMKFNTLVNKIKNMDK
jgi:UDP-N-acetylmuramoyl-tripeptide--D-alanyl-D-alanine ligase